MEKFLVYSRGNKALYVWSFHTLYLHPKHWKSIQIKSLIYGIMERLDQGHLHPLLEHPETNMSRPGIECASPASQAGTLSKS
jgi:hypothetical protein